MTFAFTFTFAFAFTLAACGGKIAGDQRASSGEDPTRDPSSGATSGSGFDPGNASSATQEPSSPFPPSTAPPSGLAQTPGGRTVDDACAAICERNGNCGAGQPDCQQYCADEINGASACSGEANAYIQCYAANLLDNGCAALPPVCETAYCAYTRCAGKVVPTYCR